MHAGFDFDAAAAQAGYLAELGVSHLYLSPILQAAPGSTHGYDVVDPTRVNRELGGAEGHARLGRALGAVGIGQLVDVVPNHMAITGRDNAWWWDVLTHGPSSVYADYFDVDWQPSDPRLRDTVLLAILGDHYGRELEAGHMALVREGDEVVLHYFDHAAPLDPSSLDTILLGAAARLPADPEDPRLELERLAGFVAALPPSSSRGGEEIADRHRATDELRARLAALGASAPSVFDAVDAELAAVNADPDAVDAVLARQNYRLAWWRSAGENLDYRRFFDINDLAAIRVEEAKVFADSHRLILAWLADGVVDGVRVDHIDGLYDPARYLRRLSAGAPSGWVLVEKILEGDEELPARWPVAGTTGYDWLNRVGDLFTHPGGWERVVAGYRQFASVTDRYEELVYRAKQEVLNGTLAADVNRLVAKLAAICERRRRYRDYTRRDLHDALAEVGAGYGVYRTYLSLAGGLETATEGADAIEDGSAAPGASQADEALVALRAPADRDVEIVTGAVRAAGMRRPDLDEALLEMLRDLLLGRLQGSGEADFALRFQQLTGPVMAKAVEDTVFYRYLPLLSLNEVGGDPGHVGADLAGFHRGNETAAAEHPAALLALSTHDTKRSEDVRARISVLAEVAGEWQDAVERWWDGVTAGGVVPPDRNTAWLLLQTLVGAWPVSAERAQAYLEKATREAKEHTSWTEPDPVYDEITAAFATGAVSDPATVAIVEELVALVRRPGRAVSLGSKLITLTAPGVPDLYQGSELWDLSLVDPDNRRPVDYDQRAKLLAGLASSTAADLWATDDDDGVVKLAVVAAALRARRELPVAYEPGSAYVPLLADGPAADHLVGFARGADAATPAALTFAIRWPVVLERNGGWRHTTITLPEGRWVDRLSGATRSGEVAAGDLLGRLPVALLVGEDDEPGAERRAGEERMADDG